MTKKHIEKDYETHRKWQVSTLKNISKDIENDYESHCFYLAKGTLFILCLHAPKMPEQ